jgi:hypothetical protein
MGTCALGSRKSVETRKREELEKIKKDEEMMRLDHEIALAKQRLEAKKLQMDSQLKKPLPP